MVQVSEDGIWGQGGRWVERPCTTWGIFNVAVIKVGTRRGYRRAWGGECALQGIGEEGVLGQQGTRVHSDPLPCLLSLLSLQGCQLEPLSLACLCAALKKCPGPLEVQ